MDVDSRLGIERGVRFGNGFGVVNSNTELTSQTHAIIFFDDRFAKHLLTTGRPPVFVVLAGVKRRGTAGQSQSVKSDNNPH